MNLREILEDYNAGFTEANEGGESGYKICIQHGKICLWKIYCPDGDAELTINEDSTENWKKRLAQIVVYEEMEADQFYAVLKGTLKGPTYNVSLWG